MAEGFSCRAQAALEYLMTYGWALVIIVTVASVLFFVLSPPENQFSCQSSDPVKMVLQSYNLPYEPVTTAACISFGGDCAYWGYPPSGEATGKFSIINGTGGNIQITKIVSSYADSAGTCNSQYSFMVLSINGQNLDYSAWPDVQAFVIPPVSIQSGAKIDLGTILTMFSTPSSSGCKIPSDYFNRNHAFMIQYTDRSGYVRDVNINCRGVPPKK
ncbi:MAG: hypothetical protein PHH08_04070 [Candidatus ainarchaeum sp.]|nr:hypothetical protein [Candidatus ainarchaeum sp.]